MTVSYKRIKKFEDDVLQDLHDKEIINRWSDEGYTSKEYNDYDAYIKWIRKDYISDHDNIHITKGDFKEIEHEVLIDSHYLEDLDVYITLTSDLN